MVMGTGYKPFLLIPCAVFVTGKLRFYFMDRKGTFCGTDRQKQHFFFSFLGHLDVVTHFHKYSYPVLPEIEGCFAEIEGKWVMKRPILPLHGKRA